VEQLLEGMERQISSLKEDLLKSIWYMRGSVSYADIMQMTDKERAIIGKIIKENLETTKKTQMPFF
jgi:hypothetical protein